MEPVGSSLHSAACLQLVLYSNQACVAAPITTTAAAAPLHLWKLPWKLLWKLLDPLHGLCPRSSAPCHRPYPRPRSRARQQLGQLVNARALRTSGPTPAKRFGRRDEHGLVHVGLALGGGLAALLLLVGAHHAVAVAARAVAARSIAAVLWGVALWRV